MKLWTAQTSLPALLQLAACGHPAMAAVTKFSNRSSLRDLGLISDV